MKIIISGDLLPTPNNEALFQSGDVEALIGKDLLALYRKADFRITNLEGPLTDSDNAIEKSGPNIKGSIRAVYGMKQMGIDCASLANNHIYDFGECGLSDTLNILKENGIDYVGAGKTLEEAGKPYYFERDGIKVGLYSCAEYEFTIAMKHRGGANPFDALNISDVIREIKKNCDFLMVLYHGGKEFYRYPVPYVQTRCRKMADSGADLILCQHSHCIGCMEDYHGTQILYGQGNFLLCRADDEYRHTGLLVSVEISSSKRKIEYVPVVRHDEKVRIATPEEKDEILKSFWKRSEKIKDATFVEENYRKFAKTLLQDYYSMQLGIFGSLLRRLHIGTSAPHFYRRRQHFWLLNAVRCEAHADVFREGMEAMLDKGE